MREEGSEEGREGGRKGGREEGKCSCLEIHTLAFVRDHKVRVNRALGSASLVGSTPTREGVALQPRPHGDVGEDVATVATLDGEPGGLCPQPRGLDHYTWHLHQSRHVL